MTGKPLTYYGISLNLNTDRGSPKPQTAALAYAENFLITIMDYSIFSKVTRFCHDLLLLPHQTL
jgi:hypothetical protein